VFDGPVLFFGSPSMADGVIKVPASGPPGEQLAARMFFVPDAQASDSGATAGSANLKNPVLDIIFFKGNLHDTRAENVYTFDATQMKQVWTGSIARGQTAEIAGGYKVSMPRVLRYTGLLVNDDPGVPIIWASFVLMLGGLMVRLYVRPVLEASARRQARAA
jgi:cytochrome c biogenesis protein ResB